MLKAIIAAYKNHSTYRATYNELSRLSNKELYDIGIDRSDIEYVARDFIHEKADTPKNKPSPKLFSGNMENKRVEAYLADSSDLVDLENRLKSIERGLAPWQVTARRYTQGWV
jgi:uncharacterized protein YjiS (DUF1127 family)